MRNPLTTIRNHRDAFTKLLPLLTFVIPILWLYGLDPGAFELMWKGRTFQLFFLWLIVLELILNWERINPKQIPKPTRARYFAVTSTSLLPTLYAVVVRSIGLDSLIAEFSRQNGVEFYGAMPLAVEYIVFTIFFCLVISLLFGKEGLGNFLVPALFLGLVGSIYTIDNIFPYGQFTPFQLFVPTTATLAANLLTVLGYQTVYTVQTLPFSGTIPFLTATDPVNPARAATFAIAWPCAGVESFLIFVPVVFLFLSRMPMSFKAKFGYFAVGAAVTCLINILRVTAIFVIGVNQGAGSEALNLFHFYTGPLISISWIVTYPLIILAAHALWRRSRTRSSQPSQLDPA